MSGAKVTVTGGGASDTQADPSVAYADIQFRSDGTTYKTESVTSTQINSSTDWIIPNARASGLYEVRRTGTTGDAPSGPAEDTWVALSSTRTWSLTQSGVGSKSTSMTIEIRRDGVVIDSATYTLGVTVF